MLAQQASSFDAGTDAADEYVSNSMSKYFTSLPLPSARMNSNSADVSGLDGNEAHHLVGKLLKIGKDKVQIGAQVCDAPDFEVINGERDEYFKRRAHASPEKLGLPNPVTSAHINCAYVYKKTSDRLVLNWQGIFFDAVRQRAKRKN